MSELLPQILAALDEQDPERANQLRAELGQSTEPARPATLLDELRADESEAASIAHSDVPSTYEVPTLLGLAVRELQALGDRVAALEGSDPPQAGQVVKPAPAEPGAPAEPAPVPADQAPPAGDPNVAADPAQLTDPNAGEVSGGPAS